MPALHPGRCSCSVPPARCKSQFLRLLLSWQFKSESQSAGLRPSVSAGHGPEELRASGLPRGGTNTLQHLISSPGRVKTPLLPLLCPRRSAEGGRAGRECAEEEILTLPRPSWLESWQLPPECPAWSRCVAFDRRTWNRGQ